MTAFNKPITEWNETTTVRVDFRNKRRFILDTQATVETVFVELPTKEIWVSGDFASRRRAGITFTLINKALNRREIMRAGLERWISVEQ